MGGNIINNHNTDNTCQNIGTSRCNRSEEGDGKRNEVNEGSINNMPATKDSLINLSVDLQAKMRKSVN